jgi:hypothetical protein
MKKIIFAFIFLLCLSGCSIDESNYDTAGELKESIITDGNQFDMLIEVYPKEISIGEIPDFIKVTVTNLSDAEYRGGWHCGIQYYDGTDWVLANAPAFPDDLIAIEPGGILDINYVQLLPIEYAHTDGYAAGRYRVKYDIWYGEFTITE